MKAYNGNVTEHGNLQVKFIKIKEVGRQDKHKKSRECNSNTRSEEEVVCGSPTKPS
jgi:hypothetical protein